MHQTETLQTEMRQTEMHLTETRQTEMLQTEMHLIRMHLTETVATKQCCRHKEERPGRGALPCYTKRTVCDDAIKNVLF